MLSEQTKNCNEPDTSPRALSTGVFQLPVKPS